MTTLRRRIKDNHRRAWSEFFSEQALDDVVNEAWSVFLAAVAMILLVIVGIVTVSPMTFLAPPIRLLGGFLFAVPGYCLYLCRYRRMQVIAGRYLGLTNKEARRLNLRTPAYLRASLARVAARRDARAQ